jgi:hypothetical protein
MAPIVMSSIGARLRAPFVNLPVRAEQVDR